MTDGAEASPQISAWMFPHLGIESRKDLLQLVRFEKGRWTQGSIQYSMINEDDSFRLVATQLGAGDQNAATAIFNRFSRQLVARARERLNSRIRRSVDPEDIVQSVFRSFFQRYEQGQFEFTDWSGIWGLLVMLTVRKCGRKAEYLGAARRDLNREISFEGLQESRQHNSDAPTREPSPEEVVMLMELIERVFEQLDQRQQKILSLRMEGYSVQEVSERVPCSMRTVFRMIDAIKAKLALLAGLDDSSEGERVQ